MMNLRLLEVALYVADIERSVAFYRALFGFDVILQDARLWAMGVEGREVLLICRRTASASLPAGAHDATGRQHVAFAIAPADLDAWADRLAAQGVAARRDEPVLPRSRRPPAGARDTRGVVDLLTRSSPPDGRPVSGGTVDTWTCSPLPGLPFSSRWRL